jgi:hypothetical protein
MPQVLSKERYSTDQSRCCESIHPQRFGQSEQDEIGEEGLISLAVPQLLVPALREALFWLWLNSKFDSTDFRDSFDWTDG